MTDSFDPSSMTPGPATGTLPSMYSSFPQGAQDFIRGHLPRNDDAALIVNFEKIPTFQTFKTKIAREGYPAEHPTRAGKTETGGVPDPNAEEIWEDVTHIRINVPGNTTLEVLRPVLPEDKRRFAHVYAAWERGGAGHQMRGTPLATVGMDPSTIRVMQAHNVFTVEDLSQVSDGNLTNLGAGGREWRHKSRQLLQARNPQTQDLQRQLEQAMAAIAQLQAQVGEQPEKRGPGRPRKEPEAA